VLLTSGVLEAALDGRFEALGGAEALAHAASHKAMSTARSSTEGTKLSLKARAALRRLSGVSVFLLKCFYSVWGFCMGAQGA
jgi:hypothetical protein